MKNLHQLAQSIESCLQEMEADTKVPEQSMAEDKTKPVTVEKVRACHGT